MTSWFWAGPDVGRDWDAFTEQHPFWGFRLNSRWWCSDWRWVPPIGLRVTIWRLVHRLGDHDKSRSACYRRSGPHNPYGLGRLEPSEPQPNSDNPQPDHSGDTYDRKAVGVRKSSPPCTKKGDGRTKSPV